jgi:hypothetical protein
MHSKIVCLRTNYSSREQYDKFSLALKPIFKKTHAVGFLSFLERLQKFCMSVYFETVKKCGIVQTGTLGGTKENE